MQYPAAASIFETAFMSATLRKTTTKWRGFRSVLCAIDFSEHSRSALRYAESTARRAASTLTAVYVNEPFLIAAAAAVRLRQNLVKRSARELKQFVEHTLSAKGAVRPKFEIAIGDPAEQILRIAARIRADLLVLGTHGLTNMERIVMGSTTLNVLQHTPVPVLAVPRAEYNQITDPAASWPGPQIIAAVDLTARSQGDDADIAAQIAEWWGTSLVLVHVVRPSAPSWLESELTAHETIAIANAERRMEALADRARKRVSTTTCVISGNIADEIAALAATERAGLVTTTLRDKTGWFGATRGSTSYHVLSHAVTPVLARPSKWEPALINVRST